MKELNKNKRAVAPLNMLIEGAIIVLIAVITVSIAVSINTAIGDSIDVNACGTNTTVVWNAPPECSSGGSGSYVNFTCNCAEWNASLKGTTGLSAFADYWVSIVSIIILVVIVGLFAYFRGGVSGVEVR